jgi:hypothetical protein
MTDACGEHMTSDQQAKIAAILTEHKPMYGWRGTSVRCLCGEALSDRNAHREHQADMIAAAAAKFALVLSEQGESLRMDGTATYRIRYADRPGVIASLRLRAEDADRLRAALTSRW